MFLNSRKLIEELLPTDIILLKDELGEGSWSKFLSLASIAGSNFLSLRKCLKDHRVGCKV